MSVLVTGGAGYIGSHTCVELLNEGYSVVVLDNLSNSKKEALDRVETITGKKLSFYQGDLLDPTFVRSIFQQEKIDAVIHFAGLKAVGESSRKPLAYYRNNITGTLNLLAEMKAFDVKKIIFSSSATVYGDAKSMPIYEDFPVSATNPYGRTKLYIESILQDICAAEEGFTAVLLRYFNPVGAHESGLIGEDPNGIPNNLAPFISQVAIGRLEALQVYGDDYPTPDGTGVRDYIHVVDLAKGHLKALEKLPGIIGVKIYNLGTGKGVSVLEMVGAFERVTGKKIPYRVTNRRPGDVATCYAHCGKAQEELNWTAEKTIDDMCRDAWRWQSKNPNGYA